MKTIQIFNEKKLNLLTKEDIELIQDFGDNEDDVIELQLYDLSNNLIKIVDDIEKDTWEKKIDTKYVKKDEPPEEPLKGNV